MDNMKGAPACLVGRRLHWLLKQEIDTLFNAEIPPLGMSPLRSSLAGCADPQWRGPSWHHPCSELQDQRAWSFNLCIKGRKVSRVYEQIQMWTNCRGSKLWTALNLGNGTRGGPEGRETSILCPSLFFWTWNG